MGRNGAIIFLFRQRDVTYRKTTGTESTTRCQSKFKFWRFVPLLLRRLVFEAAVAGDSRRCGGTAGNALVVQR